MCALEIADIPCWLVSLCISMLSMLTMVLTQVCFKRENPAFNRFLFEAVATIVRRGCEKDPSYVTNFKTYFLPCYWEIMDSGATELFPYMFQLVAQLVDLNGPSVPLPLSYIQTFDMMFLGTGVWEKSANIPALVRFLQSIIQQAPNEVNTTCVLGI